MKPNKIMVMLCITVMALAGCSGTNPGNDRNATPSPNHGGGGELISQSELRDYAPDSPEYFAGLIGDTIYFEVDQSNISDVSVEVLRKQAEWLNQYPEFSIVVEGHADEQGTREYNLALGARRAAAVKVFLVGLGVADSRLSTVSYGKERPVAVCSSESCWSKNRRSVTALERESGG